MFVMGDIAITAVVLITNIYMIVNAAALTILNWIALAVGLILYACTFIFFSVSWEPSFDADGYGLGVPVFGTLSTWLYLLVVIVLAMGPTQTLLCYWRLTQPLTYQTLQMLPIPKKERNHHYHKQKSVKHLLQKQSSIHIHHQASKLSPQASRLHSNGPTPPNEAANGVPFSLVSKAEQQPLPSTPFPASPTGPIDGHAALVSHSALSSTLSPRPQHTEAERDAELRGLGEVGARVSASDVELQRVAHSAGSATAAKRLSAQRKQQLLEEHKQREEEDGKGGGGR